MTEEFDVVVIGAGPAGMAAAVTASSSGARTLMLDENAGHGGQIYRAIDSTPVRRRRILGGEYWLGENWSQRLKRSAVQFRPRTAVWSLRAEAGSVEFGVNGPDGAALLRARQAVVATGAMERPFPIPGWTLPGVMTVGAAQTLLKSSGLVPQGDVILAGSGPLLYLFARQMVAAGAPPALILDTTPAANWMSARWHLPAFVASRYLTKGLRLLAAVRRRVPLVSRVAGLRIEGEDRARTVVWLQNGVEMRRTADLVLLHQGVVPTINLWSAAGCRSQWNGSQSCWHPEIDAWGQSSLPGILIAGDGAGIAGAEIAALRGVLAGLQAAQLCGRIDEASRDMRARSVQSALSRFLRGRDFLDALYRPAAWARQPQGDTVVCRCEEVTAAQIAGAVAAGCAGPNQMKSYLRCGMGPCQGRQCALTVTELMAELKGMAPSDIGHFRLRPPVKPVTLGALASLPASAADRSSVVRI